MIFTQLRAILVLSNLAHINVLETHSQVIPWALGIQWPGCLTWSSIQKMASVLTSHHIHSTSRSRGQAQAQSVSLHPKAVETLAHPLKATNYQFQQRTWILSQNQGLWDQTAELCLTSLSFWDSSIKKIHVKCLAHGKCSVLDLLFTISYFCHFKDWTSNTYSSTSHYEFN